MELWIFHSTDLYRGVIKAIEKGTMETFDHSEREAGKSVASLVGVFLGALGLNQLPRIVWSTKQPIYAIAIQHSDEIISKVWGSQQ